MEREIYSYTNSYAYIQIYILTHRHTDIYTYRDKHIHTHRY